MRLLQRLFQKPRNEEAVVTSTGWLRDDNVVHRRFTALTTLEVTGMCFFARCEFFKREPVLLLTFDIHPPLSATPGYLSARCSSSAGDSGFCVVELAREKEVTSIKFIDDSAKRIVPRFSDGQTNQLWFGGEAGTLLQLTVPFEPGFEAQIEKAWEWGFDNAKDISNS